ncbi:13884_t:CDS:1, partial [Funneliformis geosporum]
IENTDNIFTIIEEVEILEIEEVASKKNNNQIQNKIDLNKPLEIRNKLDEVKKNLYNAMCYYWKFLPEDLISTILDPRIKNMNVEIEEEEIL